MQLVRAAFHTPTEHLLTHSRGQAPAKVYWQVPVGHLPNSQGVTSPSPRASLPRPWHPPPSRLFPFLLLCHTAPPPHLLAASSCTARAAPTLGAWWCSRATAARA